MLLPVVYSLAWAKGILRVVVATLVAIRILRTPRLGKAAGTQATKIAIASQTKAAAAAKPAQAAKAAGRCRNRASGAP